MAIGWDFNFLRVAMSGKMFSRMCESTSLGFDAGTLICNKSK